MTAVGVVSYIEAQKLADLADGIAALTLEGLQGIVRCISCPSLML